MNLPELEAEALKLPVAERARLAETLLASLNELSEEEHRRLWTEEATRRDAELMQIRPGGDWPRTSFVTPARGSGDVAQMFKDVRVPGTGQDPAYGNSLNPARALQRQTKR